MFSLNLKALEDDFSGSSADFLFRLRVSALRKSKIMFTRENEKMLLSVDKRMRIFSYFESFELEILSSGLRDEKASFAEWKVGELSERGEELPGQETGRWRTKPTPTTAMMQQRATPTTATTKVPEMKQCNNSAQFQTLFWYHHLDSSHPMVHVFCENQM